eukprot:TRINITY_DN24817_c0_g1_i1.p1 TRINITY_DN24817_c0_g1~~TRINITY_DN24817_c0_g1_i1.p1  ORF type:complete len:804 (+),score=279.94 TRINITY_DN24817_c0_g1_i1:46-2412(+)
MLRSLVGSEMCIRDRYQRRVRAPWIRTMSSDEDYDPVQEKMEAMQAEEDALERAGEAADAQRQEDVRNGLNTQQERKRMSSLHNMLDKTACYSQFVSSQIKKVDANIQGKRKSTGDGTDKSGNSTQLGKVGEKRKASKNQGSSSKAAKVEEVHEAQPELITGGKMRDYQLQGTAWLTSLFENGMNGILGDEMGLGKTVQTIAFLAHIFNQGVKGPFLVVGPLSVLKNWVREIEFWCPAMVPQLYHGKQEERAAMRKDWGVDKQDPPQNKVHVIVTSFEIVMRDIAFFQRPAKGWANWKYLTVDEGHRLKNKDCRLIRELKTIPVDNRLLLTGTPLQNNLNELWSLLNFILPTIFESLATFQSWFDFDESNVNDTERIIQQEQESQIVAKLHEILKPFMLRRQKKDVDLEIPRKKEIIVYCPSSETQINMYRNILMYRSINPPESDDEAEFLGRGQRARDDVCYDEEAVTERQWCRAVDNEQDIEEFEQSVVSAKHGATKKNMKQTEPLSRTSSKKIKKTSLNNMLMQLRKVCNHPYLFEEKDTEITDDAIIECSGKMQMLDRLLPRLFAGGHKVLVFSQMTKMLSIIEDYFLHKGMNYCRIDGSTNLEDRQQQMDDFNTDPNVSCFLLSTRAGGLGINLVAADTVVIFDSDWNPQADLQAQDRCHRIGQKKPVLVYRLCAANSVEENMLEKAANKRRLEHLVVSNGKFVEAGATSRKEDIKGLNPEEMLAMLDDKYADEKVRKDLLSEQDIAALLDRTSLFRDAKNAKQANKSSKFKVLAEDADAPLF